MKMWADTLNTPALQIARLPDYTAAECARLLHGEDTCAETKAAIVKRLRRKPSPIGNRQSAIGNPP